MRPHRQTWRFLRRPRLAVLALPVLALPVLALPVLALLAAAAGCQGASDGLTPELALELGRRYVGDPAVRRALLEESLVSRTNGYARLRLGNYDEEHWGALEVHAPRLRPVEPSDLGTLQPGQGPAVDERFEPLDLEAAQRALEDGDEAALVAFGKQAFFRYPVQLAPYLPVALEDEESLARYGLWNHDGQVGGAVFAELAGGRVQAALTCATCHAAPRGGRLVAGLNNGEFDLGKLLADAGGDPASRGWGPGRVDVTSDGQLNPTAITDLRAVRSQQHLHKAATLRNDLGALAVRIETLIITSHGQSVRPPREVAFALALYLWRMELQPATSGAGGDAVGRGAALFRTECARCHRGEGTSGPAVALEVVGTDPTVGLSPERTTGFYRVPSLRGVRDRRRLFAGGQLEELGGLLDPGRPEQGHRYGLDLDERDRADLLAYLETL